MIDILRRVNGGGEGGKAFHCNMEQSVGTLRYHVRRLVNFNECHVQARRGIGCEV